MLFHAAIACLTILSVSVLIAHAIDAFRTQRNRSHVAVWPDAPKHFFRPSSKARSARPIPGCVPSSVAQPAEPEEIDIVVFGHPTFLVEGKPITPPVVAADDESPQVYEPVPFVSPPQRFAPRPTERIARGFDAFVK